MTTGRRAPSTSRLANLSGRRRRRSVEIEAIGHVIRCGDSRIQRGESESCFAELDEAHMRMERFGNITLLRVRAEDHATDARSVTELRVRITDRSAAFPKLFLQRLDVIIPPAPIVPGDKDNGRRPLFLKT